MAKLFYDVPTLTVFNNLESKNTKSIYFIHDCGLIWTQNAFFGADAVNAYVDKEVVVYYTNTPAWTDTWENEVSNDDTKKKGCIIPLHFVTKDGNELALTSNMVTIASQTGTLKCKYVSGNVSGNLYIYNATDNATASDMIIKINYNNIFVKYINISIKVI